MKPHLLLNLLHAVQERGLGLPRLIILLDLAMADGYRCRPTDLAHTCCLTTAAITGHVEWLVQKGWVVRVDSPSRNSYFAQLTPAGAAQLLLCGITTEQIETACAA